MIIVVSKEEILSGDTVPALSTLKKLIESPESAKQYKEKVDIALHGCNDCTEELFEIPEVRYNKLDEQFPFWLYLLPKKHLGLQALLLSFLHPSL